MRCFFSLSSVSVAAPTLDDGDAAGELRQTLLQLLAVEVRVGLLDLPFDHLDAALDRIGLTAAVDDRRLFLGDCDALGLRRAVPG